jgi:hypothetical protein
MGEGRGRGKHTDDEGVLGQLFIETFWLGAVNVEVQRLGLCNEGREEEELQYLGQP